MYVTNRCNSVDTCQPSTKTVEVVVKTQLSSVQCSQTQTTTTQNDTKHTDVERCARPPVEIIRPGLPGPPGADGAGVLPAYMFSWGDAPATLFVSSGPGIVTVVRIQMTEAFDGAGASIRIGTTVNPDAILPAVWVNPYSVLEFENTPDLQVAADTHIRLVVQPGTATKGAGMVFISFIPIA